MKRTKYEQLKDKMEERHHRKEFLEEFQQAQNKWLFLIEHPSIFNTVGNSAPSGLQSFPNCLLPNGTTTQTQTSVTSSATANTAHNLVVPYIFTVTLNPNIDPTGVGIANTTISLVNGGTNVFAGAPYGQDYFGLVGGLGGSNGPTNLYQNQNGAITQNGIQVTAVSPSIVYVTFREYTVGNLQWIITDVNGQAVGTYPTTYSTVSTPWTTPNSTSRCIVIITLNESITFNAVATPSNLI